MQGELCAKGAARTVALLSYLGVLLNLNPLMEFDGYYVLSDLLEKPNLRPRALAWRGRDLIPALRTSGGLKGHRLELLYRLVEQGWMEGILPDVLAAALAWALAAAVVVLAAVSVLCELRGAT